MEDNKIRVRIDKNAEGYIDAAIAVLKETKWKTRQDLRSANIIYQLLQKAKIALPKEDNEEMVPYKEEK